ncbi:MAG: hypothetical protein HYR66_15590 [Sphingobacteriales bacterium]|nr:hypothetical protein [Sphingobacteriales bacterium]MBI3720845.1 hypothetical protein [Sphingobacteriales bacterium]
MKFTYAAYEDMLRTLKEDYEFISFSRAKFGREKMEKKVLLRHDIDQSVEKTEKIGEIEANLGISSTFFFLFRSPFYNMFSYDEEKIIRKLIAQNHFIGLHFDYTGYSFKAFSQLSNQIMMEAEFIQRYYNVKVDAVSFHRPFDVEHFRRLELGAYPHAYESVFLEEFKYYSDSTGRWRFGTPLESDTYRNRENLQILIHPEWWNEEELESLETVNNYRKDYNAKFEKFLQSEMKGFWDSLKQKNQ